CGYPCTAQYPNYDPNCNNGSYPYPQPQPQPYYPPAPRGYGGYGYGGYGYGGAITASPASLNPGDSTVVSGTGFAPGDTVDLALNGQSLGTTVVDPGGNFRQTVTVPANVYGGNY